MVMSKQTQPFQDIPAGRLKMDIFSPIRPKEKVVVVMGATGTGKSRLSIDLATRFPAEIINSDKIQVYKGLNIVTNKVTEEECRGIPHHLLGIIDPDQEFTARNFCDMASLAIEQIVGRGQVPIIAGGSNSYIEALVDDYDASNFCFLWVDVSMPILHTFLADRVDKMVQSGMVEDALNFFDPSGNYSRGIRKATGVPEFDSYFRTRELVDEETQAKVLQQAIQEIKDNTCKLGCRQVEKIHRLRNIKGWKLHRLNATEVFRKRGKEADEAWEKLVVRPSAAIVNQFLHRPRVVSTSKVSSKATVAAIAPAIMAAATH
ncbi:hypothetical protein RJ641_031008 [Dillenia turbinata]|uniref:adenylate dimethylallyltransferase (ADP/ATP-dependent) n=1 Tax=Dillenia turbinata TaxID=194707 RepID=A0AAN8ZKI8_9MAGN